MKEKTNSHREDKPDVATLERNNQGGESTQTVTHLEKLKEEILFIDDERLFYYFKVHNKAILKDKPKNPYEEGTKEFGIYFRAICDYGYKIKKGLK